MMYWGHGMGLWGLVMMAPAVAIFTALVVAGLVIAVRASRRPEPQPPTGPDARQVLAERFARGDIDEVEYRHRLDVLGLTRQS